MFSQELFFKTFAERTTKAAVTTKIITKSNKQKKS